MSINSPWRWMRATATHASTKLGSSASARSSSCSAWSRSSLRRICSATSPPRRTGRPRRCACRRGGARRRCRGTIRGARRRPSFAACGVAPTTAAAQRPRIVVHVAACPARRPGAARRCAAEISGAAARRALPSASIGLGGRYRRSSDRMNRGHEAKPHPRHGYQVAAVLRVITQRMTKAGDHLTQVVLFDHQARPQRPHQRVLVHQPPVRLDEQQQGIEQPRRQRHGAAVAAQQTPLRAIEHEVAEREAVRSGHGADSAPFFRKSFRSGPMTRANSASHSAPARCHRRAPSPCSPGDHPCGFQAHSMRLAATPRRARFPWRGACGACCWPARPQRWQPARSTPDELARRPMFMWTQAEREFGFAHWDRLYPRAGHRARTGGARPAAGAPLAGFEPGGAGRPQLQRNVDDFGLAGIVVLHRGQLRLEHYAHGFGAGGRWVSFSLAKSLTSYPGRRRHPGWLHRQRRRCRHALHPRAEGQRLRGGHAAAAAEHVLGRQVVRGLRRSRVGLRAVLHRRPSRRASTPPSTT